jgi:hypothetical protein
MNLRSILAWSLGLVASAPGAESELARLERDYLAQRDAAVRPLLTAFADELRSLHLSLVQRRDPRAAEVKAELDRALSRLSPPATGGALEAAARPKPGTDTVAPQSASGTLDLRGAKATLSGAALYDEKSLAAVQFKGKGGAAEWTFPPLNAGRYRLKLDWGCAPGFGALAHLSFGNLPPRTLTIQPTGDSGQAASFNLGEVELPRGIISVRVAMADVPPRTKGTGGFNLHLVSLSPVEQPGGLPGN